MEFLNHIFGYLCGQGRCFEIDGRLLPVCQRCLGLYAAAAFTGFYLLITRCWRRGLPPACLVLLHGAMLLTALIAGLHIMDLGPTFRLLCGAWTGHIVVIWLTGATVHFYLPAQNQPLKPFAWTRSHIIEALFCAAAVSAFAPAFSHLRFLGWYFWNIVILIGALFLLGAVSCACVNLIRALVLRPKLNSSC